MVELVKKVYSIMFVAFICQKLFFHNGAVGYFGFTPLKKMPGFLRRTLELNIF